MNIEELAQSIFIQLYKSNTILPDKEEWEKKLSVVIIDFKTDNEKRLFLDYIKRIYYTKVISRINEQRVKYQGFVFVNHYKLHEELFEWLGGTTISDFKVRKQNIPNSILQKNTHIDILELIKFLNRKIFKDSKVEDFEKLVGRPIKNTHKEWTLKISNKGFGYLIDAFQKKGIFIERHFPNLLLGNCQIKSRSGRIINRNSLDGYKTQSKSGLNSKEEEMIDSAAKNIKKQ